MDGKNILLFSKDFPTIESITAALSENSYNVIVENDIEKCKINIKISSFIIDIENINSETIEFVKSVLIDKFQVKVILLTSTEDDPNIMDLLVYGAAGYIIKPIDTVNLMMMISDIYKGIIPLGYKIYRALLKSYEASLSNVKEFELTEREKSILSYFTTGATYKAIADKLYISDYTVNYHLKHIYRKLNVNSKAEAVAVYLTCKK